MLLVIFAIIYYMLTCSPALADRETALAFAFPESLPALPPAFKNKHKGVNIYDRNYIFKCHY